MSGYLFGYQGFAAIRGKRFHLEFFLRHLERDRKIWVENSHHGVHSAVLLLHFPSLLTPPKNQDLDPVLYHIECSSYFNILKCVLKLVCIFI